MSILNTLHRIGILTRASLPHKLDPARAITFSFAHCSESTEQENGAKDKNFVEDSAIATRPVISVETSIEYMDSSAYKQTYGDDPVWKPYRRNHKGQFAPRKTRKTCISWSNLYWKSLSICRDEYLVLDYRNVKLLEQFINKYNGNTLSYTQTGICQRKYKELLIALFKAKDCGIITYDVPMRKYDYSEWKPAEN